MSSASFFAGLAALLVALFLWLRKQPKHYLPLPPGPSPVPLLGNVRDLTAKELWLPATQWSKTYGDVTYLHVFGQGLVFLNSPEAAYDLLDKKGSLYSDKPQLVMVCDLCGCGNMVAFTGYGEQSKRQRRLMHKAFGLPAIPTYHPLLITSTHSFLRQVITSPEAYVDHTRRYAGSLTLSVVYGYEPTLTNDPFLGLAEECVGLLANKIASGGGIWPVDVLPVLRHLPEWAPGAGFLKNAKLWKGRMEEFVDRPYAWVKKSMESGNYKPSFCSTLLDEQDPERSGKLSPEFEFDLKWTANSMYSASMDTTMTTVSHFLLAMMNNPAVMHRAQQEIDSVTGGERLPNFSDRPNLPFVDAIMSETWRWGVPVPLSLPHSLMEEDTYRGMRIPKGSLVFGNVWAMMRDQRMYPEPERFWPERFLYEEGVGGSLPSRDEFGKTTLTEEEEREWQRKRDPRGYVFGFGRRLCPGNNLVESSIWLLLVNMLATLDISKEKDEKGNEIDPVLEFENPIFRIPKTFKCDIKPRSEQAVTLIMQSDLL